MNMSNLPIKKGIEELLEKHGVYTGIFEIRSKERYLKLTSKIDRPPVEISIFDKEAVKKVLRCARVYKVFIKEGMYHPETQIVVYKDGDNFALMVIMPKLKVYRDNKTIYASNDEVKKTLSDIEKKLGLKKQIYNDMGLEFNWGYDEKGNLYAHDLHLGEHYDQILEIADKMGIK